MHTSADYRIYNQFTRKANESLERLRPSQFVPDQEFRLEAGPAQRLKGAGLVGAECTAALQDQHTLRLGRRRRGRGIGNIHRDRQFEGNSISTVAAVRDGVNRRDTTLDHAEFIRISLMQE